MMLSDMFPPFIGGVEQHVRNLAAGLVEFGHNVTVVTMADANNEGRTEENGVDVIRIRGTAHRLSGLAGLGRPYSPPFPDPEAMLAIKKLVAQQRPEVIHAHNWMVDSFAPIKPRGGVALAVSLHGYDIVCAKRSLMHYRHPCTGPGIVKCLRCASSTYGPAKGLAITVGNWAMQPVLRATVDIFLPVSKAVAIGNELGPRGLEFEVVPNFVPDDVAAHYDDDDAALGALPREPYLLYVGALRSHKGINILMEAYERMDTRIPLVLIGTRWGDTPRTFPPNVVVLEDLSHAAVMAAWRRALLGIVPSLAPDPCPTVALEGMAAGVPLVGSRTGGLTDMIHDGLTGLLVPPGRPIELAAAITSLVANEEMRSAMGAAARSALGPFTASVVVAQLDGIYRRIATH